MAWALARCSGGGTVSEIADFIRAQYDRIEAAAQAATGGPWRVGDVVGELGSADVYGPDGRVTSAREEPCCSIEDAEHMAINDPDYVLADIASKRQIVATFVALDTHPDRLTYAQMQQQWVALRAVMAALAAPFSAEPGYKQEWAV